MWEDFKQEIKRELLGFYKVAALMLILFITILPVVTFVAFGSLKFARYVDENWFSDKPAEQKVEPQEKMIFYGYNTNTNTKETEIMGRDLGHISLEKEKAE